MPAANKSIVAVILNDTRNLRSLMLCNKSYYNTLFVIFFIRVRSLCNRSAMKFSQERTAQHNILHISRVYVIRLWKWKSSNQRWRSNGWDRKCCLGWASIQADVYERLTLCIDFLSHVSSHTSSLSFSCLASLNKLITSSRHEKEPTGSKRLWSLGLRLLRLVVHGIAVSPGATVTFDRLVELIYGSLELYNDILSYVRRNLTPCCRTQFLSNWPFDPNSDHNPK